MYILQLNMIEQESPKNISLSLAPCMVIFDASGTGSRGGPFGHISLNIKERFPARVILYALCHKKTENIFLEMKI